VPLTFFAHQAPVLPVARRWPHLVDGVALVIGSMAPDLAFVLGGTRCDFDAHTFPAWLLFGVPATLVISWIVVRVLAPVVPDHLPDRAPFHLGDYRGLATHRFRPLLLLTSAVAGVLSHLALDQFTHSWGWFAQHIDWWSTPIVERQVLGRQWPPYRLLEYAGHVVGTAACLWLLARAGRERWMAARAAEVAPCAPSAASRAVLGGATGAGLAAGVLWGVLGFAGKGALILRLAGGVFVGMAVGAVIVARAARREPVTQGATTAA
jgi:hypothetical protein